MIFIKTKAFVINKKDINEADRYVTLFTEDLGKISVLVKGIRKSKKRDKTAVDVLSLTEYTFYKKADNFIVTGFTNLDSYEEIRLNIDNLYLALYCFDILNNILVERSRNIKIFNLLKKTLNYLKTSNDLRKNYILILFFIFKIIEDEGVIYTLDEGLYFSFENSTTFKNEIGSSYKLKSYEKEILELLLKNKIPLLLKEEAYNEKMILELILFLEEYMLFHFDIKISIKNFLWG